MNTLLARVSKAEGSERGFTLLELLVVIIIIGILAAVAIPAFLNQRQKANDAAVKSDLKNAAILMEDALIDTGKYPSTLPAGYQATEGVIVGIGGAEPLPAEIQAFVDFMAFCNAQAGTSCVQPPETDYYGSGSYRGAVVMEVPGNTIIIPAGSNLGFYHPIIGYTGDATNVPPAGTPLGVVTDGNTYCLEGYHTNGTGSEGDPQKFHVSSEGGGVKAGACPAA